MYEELVKRLREADKKSMCLNLHTGATKKGVLFAEAADAIEELSKQNEKWEEALKTTLDFIPCWIPVTERLPEADGQVLAYYGFNGGDGNLGMMFMQILDYYATDPKPHFQHESMGVTVTHWMPIPEPPKEET